MKIVVLYLYVRFKRFPNKRNYARRRDIESQTKSQFFKSGELSLSCIII